MFMGHILARTIALEEDCRSAVSIRREKKKPSCTLLLLLAKFPKDEKPEPVIAKISQETLAEMNWHDAQLGDSQSLFHEQVSKARLHQNTMAASKCTARC